MALRFLATAGDTLHTRPPVNLPFLLINEYGPTENTVDAAWAVVAPGEEKGRPSIGRPIGNVKAYVLDDYRRPVQPGNEGELYLGGEQVARGYLNRPELTAERFLPDPFTSKAGARMYRTGDFVRLQEGGELHSLGRRDNQVQIRGRRVELAEIEQTLLAHHEVNQACCEPLLDGASTYGIAATTFAT
jgi:non-ribosomal peptide synthetase component F